jgi:gluconate 2-dehydrogenase gamma chain
MLAAVPGLLEACGGSGGRVTVSTAPPIGARESLTANQARTLQAALERLIPSDSSGPGAREAKVWRYIDHALAHGYKSLAPVYDANLAALDSYAKKQHGKAFADLSEDDQDAVLTDVQDGKAEGFELGSAGFFELLWEHTLEGMFGDPYHGGNDEFVGWKMIEFPGVKLLVTPEQQQIGTEVPLESKSVMAYKSMFTTLDPEE